MFNGNKTTAAKRSKPFAATILGTACAMLLAAGLIAAPMSALAQSSAPATGTTEKAKPKPKRALTPGQIAARERQKKCAAEWKEAKAAGKVEKGMKWPQYWSACNKRLKGAA